MHTTTSRGRGGEYRGLAVCGALIAICTFAIQSLIPILAIAVVAAVCLAVGVIWFGLLIRDWWREIDTLLAEDPAEDHMALWPDEPEENTWQQ